MNYFAHPTAIIDPGAEIGEGTKIWHFNHIESSASIGVHCSLGQNVYVGARTRIGNFVKIQNNVSIYEGVTLDDYVFCGPSVVFTNVLYPRSKYPQESTASYIPTLVAEGATIGANATILCGLNVGRHALIGAGAVVVKDVPDFAVVHGNPARRSGWVSEAGAPLHFDQTNTAYCKRSGSTYLLVNGVVTEK